MVKKSVNRINADFEFSANIDHNGSKGTFREQIIKNFLRPFLPGCYGVSGGQAFDKNGELSCQLDIVIYDAIYSYIAPYMDNFIYFPCESVYGNIEIKSKLDKQSFEEAIKNIESLKRLKREPIDKYYVNPMKPLNITNIKWDIQAVNEYFGVIFAYSSVKAETILHYIKKITEKGEINRNDLPNMIVLLKEKKIITRFVRCKDNMYEIRPIGEYNGFLIEETGDNVLTEFLMILFVMLRSIELKAMDIQNLTVNIQEEIFKKDDKKIIKNIIIP
ncbi:MAG: hypothetical protein J5507_04605 [Clostridia bacterium]|nr:hypothetical protein [Clostridia bacterium]